MSDDRPAPERSDETPAVVDAARKIASGDPIDWRALESGAKDDESRAVLERLHDVEGIAAFHRTWRGDATETPEGAPTTWGTLAIIEQIGRGSFGRVFRAHDPRLDRDVALKILDPGQISDSPHAHAVIEEGRHLARLRHPNIVTIHGADRIAGRVGLEMELIIGRTLADIVQTQGPFGPDEAAIICRDVARALAAVHRAGLVHRDIKAQNVIRERGGRIVLMDFGAGRLADVLASAGIAGTPVYLAPEVLDGSGPTAQSDLYSLGVLLYYLVTGSFPIEATTLDDLRAVHTAGTSPRLRNVRADLPERFSQLVERALAPQLSHRIDSAGTFEAELTRVLGAVDRPRSVQPPRWRVAALLMTIATAAACAWALWPRPEASAHPVRFTVPVEGHLTIPSGPGSREFALSPDGKVLVYAAMAPGRRQSYLYVRHLDQGESRLISETTNGGQPFFSPDGARIGLHDNKLRTFSLDGGPPVTVTEMTAAGGASWARDRTIVFSSERDLWRVPENGGTPVRLTTVDAGLDQQAIRPHVLPSGDILFTLRQQGGTKSDIYVLRRDGVIARLVEHATSAQYLPPGYLVYVAGNPPWITAAPFDVERLALTGQSVQVQAVKPGTHWFDVSASGLIAFSLPDEPSPGDAPRLVWLDRASGRESPFMAALRPGEYLPHSLRVSPDGSRMAFTRTASPLLETVDISQPGLLSIGDLDRGVIGAPLTMEPVHPLAWSRDGARITYRTHAGAIAWRRIDGSGGEEILANPRPGLQCNTGDWSPDGRILLLGCGAPIGAAVHRQMMKLSFPSAELVGRSPVVPEPYFLEPPGQGGPSFSSDGRWVTISSNVPGISGARVFVRPFPGPDAPTPIVEELSRFPIWRGRELFYLTRTELKVVAIRTQPTLKFEPARAVFANFEPYDILNDGRLTFDVSADGRRILLLNQGSGRGGDYLTGVTVVLNWVEEIKAKHAHR